LKAKKVSEGIDGDEAIEMHDAWKVVELSRAGNYGGYGRLSNRKGACWLRESTPRGEGSRGHIEDGESGDCLVVEIMDRRFSASTGSIHDDTYKARSERTAHL
jgi:hypothetical protein